MIWGKFIHDSNSSLVPKLLVLGYFESLRISYYFVIVMMCWCYPSCHCHDVLILFILSLSCCADVAHFVIVMMCWCWLSCHAVLMLIILSYCADVDHFVMMWWCWSSCHAVLITYNSPLIRIPPIFERGIARAVPFFLPKSMLLFLVVYYFFYKLSTYLNNSLHS